MSGEELSIDLKNDIELAFNLFKNENNKINKLKLRTMLFCTNQAQETSINSSKSKHQKTRSFSHLKKFADLSTTN